MPKILVIDDSKSVLSFVERTLQEKSHSVLALSSGREALRLLKTHPVDLVITDIYMPPPDGLEILRHARELKLSVPFIVMSTRQGPMNMSTPARGLGARTFLQKPFTEKSLIEAVEGVLNHNKTPAKPEPVHRNPVSHRK